MVGHAVALAVADHAAVLVSRRPRGAGSTPHVWDAALQAATLHALEGFGQSVAARQATQAPAPSHAFPPPSAQAVPMGAGVVPQVCAAASHAAVLQTVDGSGRKSAAAMHATQAPMPSHALPPFSLHPVPMGAGVVPQHPAWQVSRTHAEVGTGHSATWVQDWALSLHLGAPPGPPVLAVVVVVVMPPVAVLAWGSLDQSGAAMASHPDAAAARAAPPSTNAARV